MRNGLRDHHESQTWATILALSHQPTAGTRQGIHARTDHFFAAALSEDSARDGDIGTTTALRRSTSTRAVAPIWVTPAALVNPSLMTRTSPRSPSIVISVSRPRP